MINLVSFLNTQANDAKEQIEAQNNIDDDNSCLLDPERENELIRAAQERYDQAQGKKTEKMPNCIEKPETVLKVNLRLSYLSAVFIHP